MVLITPPVARQGRFLVMLALWLRARKRAQAKPAA